LNALLMTARNEGPLPPAALASRRWKLPPRLRLATCTPRSAAYSTPASTPLVGQLPLTLHTLTPTRVTPEVTPAAALALLLTVAPTCVPW
jgi:hypothetical protein